MYLVTDTVRPCVGDRTGLHELLPLVVSRWVDDRVIRTVEELGGLVGPGVGALVGMDEPYRLEVWPLERGWHRAQRHPQHLHAEMRRAEVSQRRELRGVWCIGGGAVGERGQGLRREERGRADLAELVLRHPQRSVLGGANHALDELLGTTQCGGWALC